MKRWTHTAVLVAATMCLAYLVLETSAWFLYRVVTHEWFSFSRAFAAMSAVRDSSDGGRVLVAQGVTVPWNMPIHPYFGFGDPPGLSFLEGNAPEQSDPNAFVVALAGESVSRYLYNDSGELLRSTLAASPKLSGKHVYLISLGNVAWRQPQQLEAVAFYLSMGGRLDLLIELDGHNEIVDPALTASQGVFPGFPLIWSELSSNTLTVDRARLVGDITFKRSLRRRIAGWFQHLRYSVSAFVLWQSLDDLIAAKIANVQLRMTELERTERASTATYRFGPKSPVRSFDEMLAFSTMVWRNASLELHHLAIGNDTRYFQFLQPNQYLSGSKPLSAEERRLAYHPPKPGIERGYPLLLQAGEELKRKGVAFFDLSGIFRDRRESLYVDDCCHVNKAGNDILAKRIAEIVAERL